MSTQAEQFELPPRIILYTLHQLSIMFNVNLETIRTSYIHYDRRSVGACPGDKLLACNIAPEGEKPDWRVAENEVIRYLKKRGFRFYTRSST